MESPSLSPTPEAVWNALWNSKGPYDLPRAITRGQRVGLVHIRPLTSVAFPETGQIILMNRDRWGSVAINFTQNAVSGLETLVNRGFEFNAAGNSFSGKIEFTGLSLSGQYSITRGKATGSALRMASRSLSTSVGDTDDDSNVTLAQQYQDELITSDSGRFMVGSYYDNNQAYCQAFQDTTFLYYYQNFPTNGKYTSTFAQQTSNAASTQNRNSVNVNADPDYPTHANAINMFLIAACNKQKNNSAAVAAAQFCAVTQGPSGTPQTVNGVMTTVANSSPPTTAPTPCTSSTPGILSTTDSSGLTVMPDWRKMRGWTQEYANAVEAAVRRIETGGQEKALGISLPEERSGPITGNFLAHFPTPVFTVTGTVGRDKDSDPVVTITGLTGDSPVVSVQIAPFAGDLSAEVSQALDKARFLKALLGKKVILALAEPAFLNYAGRMMTLALGQKLGTLAS